MNHELVITEKDLQTRFKNERDMVTLSPYRVGDHVVRCSSCRTIIKSEFISGCCPICGHSPFLSAPVNTGMVETTSRSRSLKLLLWLLLLSTAVSILPYAFPGMTEFINVATFEIGFRTSMLCMLAVSLITAVIIYNNRKSRKLWQNSNGGILLLLIPAGAPYLILAAIWTVIFIISIFVVIVCITILIAIIASVFE